MVPFKGYSKEDERSIPRGQAQNSQTTFGDWVSFLRQGIQGAGIDNRLLQGMDWRALEGAIQQRGGSFDPGGYSGGKAALLDPRLVSMIGQQAGGTPSSFLALPEARQGSGFQISGYGLG